MTCIRIDVDAIEHVRTPEDFGAQAVEICDGFACGKCGASDAWILTMQAISAIMDRLMVARETGRELTPPVCFGHARLSDGTPFRSAADAERILRERVAAAPEDARRHLRLANHLCWRNKRDEAIGLYRRAVALDPLDAELQFALARTLYEMNRDAEALPEFKKAMAVLHDWDDTSEMRFMMASTVAECILNLSDGGDFFPEGWKPKRPLAPAPLATDAPTVLLTEYDISQPSEWKRFVNGLLGDFRMKDGRTAARAVADAGLVSRNAPCPCGSGRKFKRCCGRATE